MRSTAVNPSDSMRCEASSTETLSEIWRSSAEDLPAVFARGLHGGLVVGDDEDFVGALDAAHRANSVGEHRVSESEAFLGREDADEALLGVAEIFYGKEQRAH